MNNKSHKPIVNQPPQWWRYSFQAWADLSGFFSDVGLTKRSNWKKLTKGLSNHNYKLTLTSNNREQFYFVQVINFDNLPLLPQGEKGQTAQPVLTYLANKPSIKSWLVDCYLSTPAIRVFDWVDFESLTIDNFNPGFASSMDLTPPFFTRDAFLLDVGDFMASLHNLEISPKGHQQPVKIDIQQHLRGYHQLAIERAPERSKHIEQLLGQSLQIAEEFNPYQLCHNDLSLNNLLWLGTPARLKVIDWEYACFSDPIMDLAGFLINFQLDFRQQQSFVEQYSNKTGTVIHPDKLTNMKQLCQNISALWQFCSI